MRTGFDRLMFHLLHFFSSVINFALTVADTVADILISVQNFGLYYHYHHGTTTKLYFLSMASNQNVESRVSDDKLCSSNE